MGQPPPRKLGHLPSQYNFSLNPYPELRFSRCPDCGQPTGQKTLPLFIYVMPSFPVLVKIACRYCRGCDTLICHKHLLEHALKCIFEPINPEIIGNEYTIVGVIEKKTWWANLTHPTPMSEIFDHLHDFVTYEELRMTMKGWFRNNQPPPIWTPPPSEEWFKQ
jgi:hypothetical protein